MRLRPCIYRLLICVEYSYVYHCVIFLVLKIQMMFLLIFPSCPTFSLPVKIVGNRLATLEARSRGHVEW